MTIATNVLATTTANYAIDIAAGLTTAMASTWYVFYVKKPTPIDQSYDSVCYGYAFHNRWVWVNNISPGVTIIFWKDYNCVTPSTNAVTDFYTVSNGQTIGMNDAFLFSYGGPKTPY